MLLVKWYCMTSETEKTAVVLKLIGKHTFDASAARVKWWLSGLSVTSSGRHNPGLIYHLIRSPVAAALTQICRTLTLKSLSYQKRFFLSPGRPFQTYFSSPITPRDLWKRHLYLSQQPQCFCKPSIICMARYSHVEIQYSVSCPEPTRQKPRRTKPCPLFQHFEMCIYVGNMFI